MSTCLSCNNAAPCVSRNCPPTAVNKESLASAVHAAYHSTAHTPLQSTLKNWPCEYLKKCEHHFSFSWLRSQLPSDRRKRAFPFHTQSGGLRLIMLDPCLDPGDTERRHLPHDIGTKGTYSCPNGYAYVVSGDPMERTLYKLMEAKSIVDNLISRTVPILQMIFQFIYSQPSVFEN
jgi:hypothetical protein